MKLAVDSNVSSLYKVNIEKGTTHMTNSVEVTEVIFKKFPKSQGGDVIAFFPCMIGDLDVFTCGSYQHIGQHASASVSLGSSLKKASDQEFAALKSELESIGYSLKVVRKFTDRQQVVRENELAKYTH